MTRLAKSEKSSWNNTARTARQPTFLACSCSRETRISATVVGALRLSCRNWASTSGVWVMRFTWKSTLYTTGQHHHSSHVGSVCTGVWLIVLQLKVNTLQYRSASPQFTSGQYVPGCAGDALHLKVNTLQCRSASPQFSCWVSTYQGVQVMRFTWKSTLYNAGQHHHSSHVGSVYT